jgi:hypothetical protein
MKRAADEAMETPETTVPDPAVVGIGEARTRLGEIADEARYLDRVTLLGKRGRQVAAVVPVEAARSRAQMADDAQISAADLAALRTRYERLERAAEATLEAREVMWIRAYVRVWEVLDGVVDGFYEAVNEAFEAEAAGEEAGLDDEEDVGWSDDPKVRARYEAAHDSHGRRRHGHLEAAGRLEEEQQDRRALARLIGDRVQALEADLENGGGWELRRGQALDWRGWRERIEHLAAAIVAAGPDGGRDFVVATERGRLAVALAEASTLLAEVERLPAAAAKPPSDVIGYAARHLWEGAAGMAAGPLVTSFATMAKGIHLDPESAQWAMTRLHQQGRVRLYRYINGYQTEVDPARLHAQAPFHVVLQGERPDDATIPRPIIVADM